MAKATNKLHSKDLRQIGFTNDQHISLALDILDRRELRSLDKGSAMALLKQIKNDPFKYVRDENWRPVAERAGAPALARRGLEPGK